MDDYALVLNAGSSSLKFCVYQRPRAEAWRLEARGQIEGIGTAPRLSAKDGAGERLADRGAWTTRVRDGRAALDALAGWLRSRYGGARVLGVGHRVVHGGAAIHRPHGDHSAGSGRAAGTRFRWPRSISRTIWRRSKRSPSGCPTCRRSPASTPAFTAASRPSRRWFRCRARSARTGVQRYGFHGLSYEYIASVLPRSGSGDRHGTRHRRSPGQRRQPVRPEGWQEHRQHSRLHGPRRTLHGHATRRARSRRDPLPVPESWALRQGSRDDPLQEVRPARAFPASATTCATCWPAASRKLGSPSTTSSTAPPRRSERWPPSWAESTDSCSPPASARTPPKSAAASARPPPGSASIWTRRRIAGKGPRISSAGKQRLGLGDPDQRGTDDCPAHRRCYWA